ncbi:MAG: hypothetical protein QXJ64_02985 [Thermosphaera sp.]
MSKIGIFQRPAIKNMYEVDVVSYGVRTAVESGAYLIKTYYTDSKERLARVAAFSSGILVLMSSGPRRSIPFEFLRDVRCHGCWCKGRRCR